MCVSLCFSVTALIFTDGTYTAVHVNFCFFPVRGKETIIQHMHCTLKLCVKFTSCPRTQVWHFYSFIALTVNKTNQLFYVSFDVSVTLAFKVLQNIHDIVDSFISFISNNRLRFLRSTDTVLGTYTSFNIINFQAFQD